MVRGRLHQSCGVLISTWPQRKAGNTISIKAALLGTVKKTDTSENAPSENVTLQVTWLRLKAGRPRLDRHQAEAKAKEGFIRQS